LLENDDPLLERGISEEEMDTDKPLETKPSDEEFYSCPMASHHLSDTSCMELSQLIRVFCGLKLSGLFVWKSEGYTILRLTTGLAPPHTNCGVNLIKVLFASLLACPFLISTKKREAAVLNWFQWLVENQSSYDNDSSSYGEMLLMAAIHFQDRQVSLIHNLVSNTLGFSVQHAVRPGKHTDIRELFLSVFSEDVVCTQALRVPPTPGFNGKMTGFYPVHCVYNLLKSQAFSNHSISVTSWVYNQIVVSSEPIHPVLPQLIQELVAAILAPPNRSMYQEAKSIFNQPLIPEGQLLVALHGSGNTEEDMSSLVVQSLILFYVLLYHEKWLKSLKTFTTWTKSFPPSYSPRLLSVTPVKYLLSHMRKHRKEFAVLYPSIVKLVTSHLPHITMVTYTTFDLSTSQLSSDKVTLSPEKAENVLLQLTTSPSRALQLVQRLLQLQPIFLKHYSSCILSTFPLLHDDSVPRPIQEGVCLLWERLNTVLTEKFWIDTVNSLSGQNKMRYSQEDLVEDPLLVLKCEPLVFQ
jgi:integrator complex subunit 2